MTREVFLVAAVAANGTIGADGAMPWHIPADLRRFKALLTQLDRAVQERRVEFSSSDQLRTPAWA